MALKVTLTSAPPMPSTVPHTGQALSGYLLVGIELIEDWLLGEGVGIRKGTLGAGEPAHRWNGPSSVGPGTDASHIGCERGRP